VPEGAKREPHVLILVGKPTDLTGFGGASFASAGLDADRAHEQKGAVQVHDPFLKRVLFEATGAVFELAAERAIEIGFKDLGAGGLACAAVELAAAAGMGMEVDLSAVPVDRPGHPPEVIACAETQERFALVVPKSLAPAVLEIYNQDYELPALYPGAGAAVVGKVLPEDRFLLKHRRAAVGDLPATVVTAGILHERAAAPLPPPPSIPAAPAIDAEATLQTLLARPNLASREFIFRGYDTDVRGRAVVRPGEGDAGVIAPVPGAPFGLAVAVGGIPAYGLVDPYLAGLHAALEAMRNVAAAGASPIALTDCLNYGSPEDPAVFAAFVAGVEGIAAAARGIGLERGTGPDGSGEPRWPVPIVSGNVSFYNHSAAGKAIAPSPIVAAVGRLADWSRALTLRVKAEGSRLLMIGARRPELGGTELLQSLGIAGRAGGPLVQPDLAQERRALDSVLELAALGHLRSAHDIGAGGLLVAIAEMLLGVQGPARIGAELELGPVAPELALAPLLFGEAPGYLFEVAPERLAAVLALLSARGVPAWDLGATRSEPRLTATRDRARLLDLGLESLAEAHRGALPALLG
jgi:phosphoribosylformylglycinamidine synthase